MNIFNGVKTYRRKKYNELWHTSQHCPGWPKDDYEEIVITTRPGYGELCAECSQIGRQIKDDARFARDISQQ